MTAPRWDFADPYLLPVTVEPTHIDALAHTRNTHYVEWCMEAAWAHTTALGLGAEDYQRLDRAMALTHAEYDYLKATFAGDQLLVGTWITDWAGKMTMTRRLQVVCEQTGETVFRGALEFVCIEISSGAPKRPPKEFIDIYGPVIVAAAPATYPLLGLAHYGCWAICPESGAIPAKTDDLPETLGTQFQGEQTIHTQCHPGAFR